MCRKRVVIIERTEFVILMVGYWCQNWKISQPWSNAVTNIMSRTNDWLRKNRFKHVYVKNWSMSYQSFSQMPLNSGGLPGFPKWSWWPESVDPFARYMAKSQSPGEPWRWEHGVQWKLRGCWIKYHWLVVDLPLWKKITVVSWDDYFYGKIKYVPNHQPGSSWEMNTDKKMSSTTISYHHYL